jgi:ribonuclease HII
VVAAASIIAKVFRDHWMRELDETYPGYGFAVHKGYPTPEHLQILGEKGASPVHRKTFRPVRDSLEELFS